jgi:hypothetical protein
MAERSDFTGRWRADLAASRLRGPTPKEIVVSLVHSDPDLRAEMTIVTADATATHIVFDARTTGEAIANTIGGAEWVSRSRWAEHELLIESDVSQAGRLMHFRDYWSLSSDGQRLTMEHRGDDLDGQLTVLHRMDGAE